MGDTIGRGLRNHQIENSHATMVSWKPDLFTASEATGSLSYGSAVMVADVESALCQTIPVRSPNWTVRPELEQHVFSDPQRRTARALQQLNTSGSLPQMLQRASFRILTIHTSRRIAICGTERTGCFGKSMNLKAIWPDSSSPKLNSRQEASESSSSRMGRHGIDTSGGMVQMLHLSG